MSDPICKGCGRIMHPYYAEVYGDHALEAEMAQELAKVRAVSAIRLRYVRALCIWEESVDAPHRVLCAACGSTWNHHEEHRSINNLPCPADPLPHKGKA